MRRSARRPRPRERCRRCARSTRRRRGAPPSADAAPPSPKKPLEAAITDSGLEDDLADPTEYVARNAAGYIDMAAAVVLPLAYLVLVLVLLGGGSEGAWGRAGFDGTEIRHLHDGAWTRWAR